jgi:ATP-dependent protease HslVU (ClpYQ) peptidase subunit
MTCIIGLAHKGHVYVGADSASVGGQEIRVTKLPKAFRKGDFLIGYTGSFRMGQILQHHLEVRPQFASETDDQYLVCTFAEAVRSCLKEHGFAQIKDNQEEIDGRFLVGYKGRLYYFDRDFQVNEHADSIDTCGCGREYALGAMKALEHLPPQERISKSLEIAAYFSNSVSGPFHVLEMTAEG